MQRKHIIIVGYGRLGQYLANCLSRLGHQIVVIDDRKPPFDNNALEFSGLKISGDVSELNTLKKAKIEEADCLFAVTDQDDLNLMVAQVAKIIFKVSQVMACISNATQGSIYCQFNIDTIDPTQLTSDGVIQTWLSSSSAANESQDKTQEKTQKEAKNGTHPHWRW